MRIATAKRIIEEGSGFLVHFEQVEGNLLRSDYTPEVTEGEPPFGTEAAAWEFAQKLAKAMAGRAVNFYVVRASDFTPVPRYRDLMIKNRKEGV